MNYAYSYWCHAYKSCSDCDVILCYHTATGIS